MSRFRRRPAEKSPGHGSPASDGTTPHRQRHAIFYDVENTSSASDVSRIVGQLEMDRARIETQLVAVGNWRVIGQETARLLAQQGAELVHSAPSTGVRDWSDLRIAVDAGIWLGAAKPGDMLDVVSDDQAFDAVGDVAATLGVRFRRIPARDRAQAQTRAPVGEAGHRGAGHPAAQEDIVRVVRRLMDDDPSGQSGVSLDVLSNALKDAGFVRAPGSHRLITRLRRMKELRVGADAMIRFASPEDAAAAAAKDVQASPGNKPRRRRGRRGGRRRGGRQGQGAANGDGASVPASDAAPREFVP